jgi:hypothetical protein
VGSIWLHNLPDWLEGAGLNVDIYDNAWATRSRSSGGYEKVLGIGIHHDASSIGSSEQSACDWGWKNSSDRPIGAIRLARDGHITIGAAGATNTMGKGGPLKCSKGTIPKDQGNMYMVAIEAANNGVGEAWGKAMLDAYISMVWVLCDELGLEHTDVFSHAGYCQPSCPGRKIDPAGPTPSHPDLGGTSGTKTWSDSAFRQYLDEYLDGPRPEPHPPEPTPEPTPPPSGGDWMANLPTIKKGDTGPYVERMQHLLAAAGYMNAGNIANYDGVWGNGTDSSKASFDNDHGLAPSPPTDCGSKSWESLMTGKKW